MGEDGQLVGVCLTQVDDLFLGLDMASAKVVAVREQMKQELDFGKYEMGHCTHCGREYFQLPDFTVIVNMDST